MRISIAQLLQRIFLFSSLFIWLSVVCLSLFHLLTSYSVWLLSFLLLLSLVWVWRKKEISVDIAWSKTSLIIVFLFSLTFLQGVVSAPNTTDSMVYHLPRVMYWIKEHSIFLDNRVTSHDFMPMVSESLVMWTMLLSGSDRFAFFPQWVAGVTVVMTTSLIAKELGLGKRERYVSILLVASLPILLLESASTQTDLVMTAFLMLSVYFALKKKLIPLAVSVALGIATKQVFVVYAIIPFFLLLPKLPNIFTTQIRAILIATALFGMIIVPSFISNSHLYGSLLGSHVLSDGSVLIYTNERMNLSLFVSNVLRNVLIQIPLPIIGRYVTAYISNDPSTTWYGSRFVASSVFIPQEDIAQAPVHLFLIVLALFFCFRSGVDVIQRKVLLLYAAAFLLFSAVLKWQPYNPRLEMSLIAVAIPSAIGIMKKYTKSLHLIAVLCIVVGFITIVANTSHPFFSYDFVFAKIKNFAPSGVKAPQSIFIQPRTDQYFSARPYWKVPYYQLEQQLASTTVQSASISLFDEYEYPLLVLLSRNKISFTHETFETLGSNTCYETLEKYGRICEATRDTSVSITSEPATAQPR